MSERTDLIRTQEAERQEEKQGSTVRELLSFVITTLLFLAAFYLVVQFVARPIVVQGSSMQNTCENKDYMIIWQLNYTPERGDIVVTDEENLLGERLVKRVIAVGGDNVQIHDGTLTVNGKEQTEPYIKEQSWGAEEYLDLTVPENSVFLMGDNRNDSTDSRIIGTLPNSSVMGKVVVRLFPFDRFGAVE